MPVREAARSEYVEIGNLMVEAYREYQAVLPGELWQRYEADLRDVAARARHATILVADNRNGIAGAVALYPVGSTDGPWPAGWAGVRVLAVSPEHRRGGIARSLMAECVDRARASGAVAVGLHTVGFMRAAVAFYNNLGMRRLPAYEVRGESGEWVLSFGMELQPGGLGSAAGVPVRPDATRRS